MVAIGAGIQQIIMVPSKVFKTNLGIKIAVLGKNQTQVKNYYLSKRFED